MGAVSDPGKVMVCSRENCAQASLRRNKNLSRRAVFVDGGGAASVQAVIDLSTCRILL
jgi:hypothetical protein